MKSNIVICLTENHKILFFHENRALQSELLSAFVFGSESKASATEVSYLYMWWDECGFKSPFNGCPNIR